MQEGLPHKPPLVITSCIPYTFRAEQWWVSSFSLVKPYFTKPYNSNEDRERAIQITSQWGKSALDYFKYYPDKFYFFSADREGFISFKVTRHFAFVLEDPVCKDEKTFIQLVKDFDVFCEENGFINVYYRVPESSQSLYKQLGKKCFPIGEEAVVDLTTFTLDGGKWNHA